MTDQESVILCAIRYTMGRQSYIVSDGQRWAEAVSRISPVVRKVLIRDLEEAVRRCDGGVHVLGDQCDEAGWRAVLLRLEAMEKTERKDAPPAIGPTWLLAR